MLDKLLVIALNDDVIHGGTEGSIKGGERMEVGHRCLNQREEGMKKRREDE